MPAGTRLVHPRALDLDDLLSVLKSVGIHVEGEDTLRDMAKHSNDWCDTVLNLALAGRKYGVRFIRPPSGGFSAQGLVEQLQAFPFVNDSARLAFVRNILPAGDRQVE